MQHSLISTLCIGGVRAGLSGEGLFALILRWTCPYADAPARHSGVMFIVSTSGPHSVTLFCSLKTFSIGGWAENGSHHLSSHGSESSPRKPSLKSKQSPSCFPVSITFMPSPCLCPSCFISGSQIGFKSPNLGSPAVLTGADPKTQEGSCCAFVTYWLVPGMWLHDCRTVQYLWQGGAECQHPG